MMKKGTKGVIFPLLVLLGPVLLYGCPAPPPDEILVKIAPKAGVEQSSWTEGKTGHLLLLSQDRIVLHSEVKDVFSGKDFSGSYIRFVSSSGKSYRWSGKYLYSNSPFRIREEALVLPDPR